MDLSLPEPVVATERLSISLSVPALAVLYDLTTVRFRAQVRPAIGSPILLYEWDSAGSTLSPNADVRYQPSGTVLTFDAPSTDMRRFFSTLILTSDKMSFAWEVGFYMPLDPTNFIAIGIGEFPVQRGVVAA